MGGDKVANIKSLNQSETEILHVLFRDPYFKVSQLSREIHRGVGGIRTNLTAVYTKLGVPEDIKDKRDYVVREYSEAYKEVFNTELPEKQPPLQPEMFISPPDPILVSESEGSETTPELQPEIYVTPPGLEPAPTLERSESVVEQQPIPSTATNNPTQNQPTTGDLVTAVVFFLIALLVAIGLGIYVSILSVTDIQIAKLDPIYYENFESEETSQGLEIIGEPYIEYGLLNSVEGLFLILGDDTWGNYTMYISVVQYACDVGEGGYSTNSTIGVRNYDWNYYPAFRFKTCEHSSPNIIKLRISVIGDLVEIKYIDWSKAPFPQNKSGNADANTGGIFIELDKSTAIDYILVVPNP